MIVRELLTRLGFQVDKKPLREFENSIGGIKRGLEGLRGALQVVGVGLSAYGAFEFLNGAAKASEDILNISQKIGVGVESLQRLKYSAELADVGLEGLAGGLKFLNKNFIEAQAGSKETSKAFSEALGGAFDPKKFKTTEDLFIAMADRFKGMEDGAKKTSLAIKIFGKSGVEMIPLLNAGSEAIRRQGEELEALGGVLGVDAIRAGDEFGDNLTRLKTFFLALRNTIAARVFPALNGMIDRFVDFMKANRELIRTKIDHYLGAIARTAKFLGAIIVFLWKGFDKLAEALGSVEGAAVAATLALAAFGVITGIVNIVTLAILSLAAAIFLLWEDYQTFAEGGESLIKWPAWIKAIKAEFEGLAKVLRGIKQLIDFIFVNPVSDFILKGLTNGLPKPVQARTREELDDAKISDIGGLAPQLDSPFLDRVSGYETAPLLGVGAPTSSDFMGTQNSSTSNNDVKVQQTINVNVQTGADVDQIAEEVARRTREENERSWLETDRALEGGAFN